MAAIQTNQLVKTFNAGKVSAVNGISLTVEAGELFGIIGPDGAGKTTLFRLLTTLLKPDSGSATIDGLDMVKDYKQIRSRVGYMPGRFSLYPDLTVIENLSFYASVFGTTIQQKYELIKDIYCRLEPFADRKAGKLSGGMKQKLALCCALIHAPSVLFLDEPTTGVDPSSRREFWDMLAKLKTHGITILVSTAYMDEASRCNRLAMMNNGRFIGIGTPQTIVNEFDKTLLAIRGDEMYRLLNDVRNIEGIEECYTFGDVHHIRLQKDTNLKMTDIEQILVHQYHHTNVKMEPCQPTMEDCFMNASKKER
ncbi:MAG: ABC transporter ATP-binding protein [Bacteroidales bacterium]|nr:ABC transporter ATP-binding protein [Bacteroidales bacterium]